MRTSSCLRGIGSLLLVFGSVLGFFSFISIGQFPFLESEGFLALIVSGIIVMLVGYYIKTEEGENGSSEFWSLHNKFWRIVRRAIGISLLLLVFVLYVPVACTSPSCLGSYAPCFGSAPESLGFLLFGNWNLFGIWGGMVYNFGMQNLFLVGLLASPFIVTGLVVLFPDAVHGVALLKSKISWAEHAIKNKYQNRRNNF